MLHWAQLRGSQIDEPDRDHSLLLDVDRLPPQLKQTPLRQRRRKRRLLPVVLAVDSMTRRHGWVLIGSRLLPGGMGTGGRRKGSCLYNQIYIIDD